ncbi:MAG: DapH/DapD/GlmU-related protein [Pseudomonadota bacterium]
MTELFAIGLGLSSYNTAGDVLETFYPTPLLGPDAAIGGAFLGGGADAADEPRDGVANVTPAHAASVAARLRDAGAENVAATAARLAEADRPLTLTLLHRDRPIAHTAEAYLKLHLLSHRLTLPNSLDLEGLFAHLPTVAWTSAGPIDATELPDRLLDARLRGERLQVDALDKFPIMANYVMPAGVRIANTARVRLGAYLGDGTTVMHEGQVNFNSGALGPNMVEGRISQGVILGAHTDLGGGASTMGTLSGGGKEVVSLGERCLVGANGGTGIPLGDRCTIEAGLYITAGTIVRLIDADGRPGERAKARELAGQSDLLFIRHSASGEIQCRTNRSAIELNETLHKHN